MLRVYCFNSLRIEMDGHSVIHFDTDKARALLVYLVLESNRPHHRKMLAGLLWSDLPEEQALHNLRQTLSYLKKSLGESNSTNSVLRVERETISINPEAHVWCDVREFQIALADAYKHYQHRYGHGLINFDRIRYAVDLYSGPFLDQLNLTGSPLFEEWATLLREELNQRAVEALSMLAEYHEKRKEYAFARQVYARITSLAPWDEAAQVQVMRLLALDGQWSGAQNQFHNLRRTLNSQLGVEPNRDTVDFFENVREAASGNVPHKIPQPIPAVKNLPVLLYPIVGRLSNLEELTDAVCNPTCRLLTLLGIGGVGKTRLALELAWQFVGVFPDGVYFVPLAGVYSPDQIVPVIAEVLGLTFFDQQDLESLVLDYLRRKTVLLVLDNFEDLLVYQGSTNILVKLIANAPGLRLLVTSRERLNLNEECIYRVEGLEYPAEDVIPSGDAVSYGALGFFEERVRQKDKNFRLNTENTPDIIRICRQLEGLPLGIEIAAGLMWNYSSRDLAQAVEQDLKILENQANNAQQRHKSLQAVFTVSWDLLPEDTRQVLARLSVFRSDFDVDAAWRVAGASLENLSILADRSLIRSLGEGRFAFHEVIRYFAQDHLAHEMPVIRRETEKTHADYYARMLRNLTSSIRSSGQKDALAVIHREFENIQQAWQFFIDHKQIEGLGSCCDALYHFFNIRSRFAEGIEWFQTAVAVLRGQDTDQIVWAKLLLRLGALARRNRQDTLAMEMLENTRQIFSKTNEHVEMAFCLINLGGIQLRRKDFASALGSTQQGLELYCLVDDAYGESYGLYLHGLILNRLGEFQKAQPILESAIRKGEQSGNLHRLIAPLNLLGDIACIYGNYDEAEGHFKQALEVCESLEDRYNQAILLNNLASVYQANKKFSRAQKAYEGSLILTREIGDRDGEAMALNSMGELAFDMGDFEQAITLSLEAFKIAHELNEEWTLIACLNNLGRSYSITGQFVKANQSFRQGIKLAGQIEAIDQIARLAINFGRYFQLRGEVQTAGILLKAALAHSSTEQVERENAENWLKEMQMDISIQPDDQLLEDTLKSLNLLHAEENRVK